MLSKYVLAVALAAAMGSSVASAQQTELIYNSYLPPMNVTHRTAVAEFAQRIEEESGGSITVTIPDAPLAPVDRQYETVMDGIADMVILPTNEMTQIVTLNLIADLPYNSPTARAASIALWETYNEYFADLDEYHGVKVLGTFVLPGRQILGIKPILDGESIKGLRLWTPPGPLADLVQGLGAAPIATAFPELFETVSRGNVDGLIIAPGSALSARILDAIKYQIIVPGGVGSVSFAVAISQERFDALDESQQQALLRAAEGLGEIVGQANDDVEVIGNQAMTSAETVPASEDLLAAIRPIAEAQIEDWKEAARAKGLADPDAALAFYQSVLEREAGQ